MGDSDISGGKAKSAFSAADFTKELTRRASSKDREYRHTEIKAIFELALEIVTEELKKGNSVTIPKMIKLGVKAKKAKPARRIRKPGTSDEYIMAKAKPASKVVKGRVIGDLKRIFD